MSNQPASDRALHGSLSLPGLKAEASRAILVSTYGDLIRLSGCRSEIDITTAEAISLCRTLVNAIKRVNPEFGEWQVEGMGHG